jgi:hypothetical protein
LQPERDGRVRCSAWLGRIVVIGFCVMLKLSNSDNTAQQCISLQGQHRHTNPGDNPPSVRHGEVIDQYCHTKECSGKNNQLREKAESGILRAFPFKHSDVDASSANKRVEKPCKRNEND